MVEVNRERLALQFDVYKVVTESSPFSEFFAEYLSRDFREDVHDFIELFNIGYNECRAIFWEADDGYSAIKRMRTPDHMFSSFKTEISPENEHSMRMAGVSIFDEERSKEIARAMKDYPEIVQAHLVFHHALREYFNQHLLGVIEEDRKRLNDYFYVDEVKILRSKIDGKIPFDELDKLALVPELEYAREAFFRALTDIENGNSDLDNLVCRNIHDVLSEKASQRLEAEYKDFEKQFDSISAFSGAASYFADLMPRVLDQALKLKDASIEEVLLVGTDLDKNAFRSDERGVLRSCPYSLSYRDYMDTEYGVDDEGNIIPTDERSPNAAMLFVIERWKQLDAADPKPMPEIDLDF